MNKIPNAKGDEFTGVDPSKSRDEEKSLKNKERAARLKGYEALIKQREEFSKRIYGVIISWLFVVAIIVLLNGWRIGGFTLYEPSFGILIGTTTANIIGLLIIVLNFVYKIHPLDNPTLEGADHKESP